MANNDTVLSQVVPDETVSTKVSRNGNTTAITDGTKAGNNLFHSFKEFSIPTKNQVWFKNTADIENIITRVTGGNISNIDGIIRTRGKANLFLINPAGIIFGPNAKLSVGGSFMATTANSLKFADGTEFSATETYTKPLLTVSVPVGVQFGKSPTAILNQAKDLEAPKNTIGEPLGLAVNPSKTIALVGGYVELSSGNITATEGRIELGAVGHNSYVSIKPIAQGWSLGYDKVATFGDIYIHTLTSVDASGKGGTIALTGKTITIAKTSQITSVTYDENPSKGVFVNASDQVIVKGDTLFYDPTQGVAYYPSAIFTISIGENSGNGGMIEINTRRLLIEKAAGIESGTLGGKGGNVIINANEVVEVKGVGGNRSSYLSAGVGPGGSQQGGSLIINTKRLIVRNGGQVDVSTLGKGQGGNLLVNASESIDVSGAGVTKTGLLFASNIYASSGAEDIADPDLREATGKGGTINLTTKTLRVNNQGQISASSIYTADAGNVNISADQIIFDNRGKLRTETVLANGGNIKLTANNLVRLNGGSEISSTAGGQGNGGNLEISAQNVVLFDTSKITAEASLGNGGNIQITTKGFFPSPFSTISATSNLGLDGQVNIREPKVDSKGKLLELPQKLVDVDNLIAFTCAANKTIAQGSFTFTGRGGIPPSAKDMINMSSAIPDFGTISVVDASLPPPENILSQTKPDANIIEAQGWLVNAQGKVVLVTDVNHPLASELVGSMPSCSSFNR